MTGQISRLRPAARAVVACFFALSFFNLVVAEEENGSTTIEHINIVHTTHTDIGFTDHPEVCRRQQMRYLDIAIDAALATSNRPAEGRFHWTAETTLAVDDWWRAADTKRREDFLQAVGTGVIAPDYMTDLDFIQSRIGDSDVIIRGCVDPKMIERGEWAGLKVMVDKLAAKSACLKRFVWGCGCVSYDTTVENLLHFKQMCLRGGL